MKTHEDLKAWLDGELHDPAFEKSVAEDPELTHEADFYRALSREIRDLAVPIAPEGGEKTIRAVRGKAPWPNVLRWQVGGLAAFSVIAFAVLAFPLYAQSKESAKNPLRTGASTISKAATANEAFRQPLPERSRSAEAEAPGQLNPNFRAESRELQERVGDKSAAGMTPSEAHEFLRPKLIRNAQLTVRVSNAIQAADDLGRKVEGWDGFVLNSQVSTQENVTTATLDLRVPVGLFEEAIRQIRATGEVVQEFSTGEDVTAQVIDSRTRVEVLADEESNVVARLNASRDAQEKAMLRMQLLRIRADLASWKAQAKMLDEQTKYSTLRVSLQQDGRASGAWGHATSGLANVGRVVGDGFIYVLVFSPVWLPLLLIGWLIRRRM